MKKYKLTDETRYRGFKELRRVVAVCDFNDVKVGDLGGWVESEKNLSHYGHAWVYDNAIVRNNAIVCDNAIVRDNAWVYDNAIVRNNAIVRGAAEIYLDAHIKSSGSYLCFRGLGNQYRNTTAYTTRNGDIRIVCGCFTGTLGEFDKEVVETHGTNKYAQEYKLMSELVKLHFGGLK